MTLRNESCISLWHPCEPFTVQTLKAVPDTNSYDVPTLFLTLRVRLIPLLRHDELVEECVRQFDILATLLVLHEATPSACTTFHECRDECHHNVKSVCLSVRGTLQHTHALRHDCKTRSVRLGRIHSVQSCSATSGPLRLFHCSSISALRSSVSVFFSHVSRNSSRVV